MYQHGVRPLIGSEVVPRRLALKAIPIRHLAAAEWGSASEPIGGPEPRRSTVRSRRRPNWAHYGPTASGTASLKAAIQLCAHSGLSRE